MPINRWSLLLFEFAKIGVFERSENQDVFFAWHIAPLLTLPFMAVAFCRASCVRACVSAYHLGC